MAVRSRQIGWSPMANALYDVLREVNALKGQFVSPQTTTTTTTIAPIFSFSVRRNNTGPCASSPVTTIYSNSSVLGSGVSVYNDAGLTSPIQSSAYICDCGNSVQYFISPTGIIYFGSPTTCI